MKKIYLVLFGLGAFAFFANGQIKLTYNSQALVIGTSQILYLIRQLAKAPMELMFCGIFQDFNLLPGNLQAIC